MSRIISEVDTYRRAIDHVEPVVGKVTVACDSADAVYHQALKQIGVNARGVHCVTALSAIFDAHLGRPCPSKIAMDAAAHDDFNEKFPEAARIMVM
jgi:hypothetical protein